jgi:cytochrome P450
VSALIKSHSDILRRYGITDSDIGKADVGILHGATSNAALVFFWLCVHIFADVELKEEIRGELLAIATEQTGKTAKGRREMVIDISRVASTCPLLHAVHQEVFRTKMFSLVTRFITADTMVSDSQGMSYLLKAGSIVQIPTAVPQTSADVWGSDAHLFHARRFLKPTVGNKEALSEAKKEQEKLQKKAFFPFSNGVHKCPGKHFATVEHLGMVAMLVLGFEITTLDGKAITIPLNPEAQRSVSAGAGKPSNEFAKLKVKVERRKGWEDVVWKFKVAEEK